MRCFVLFVFSLFFLSAIAQSVPAKSWPTSWNATVLVTMSDIVIGAPVDVFYDSTRLTQVAYFSQCAIAGGLVNNLPCIQIQSSVSSNFGIWTIYNNTCCTDFTTVGYLNPNWPATTEYQGVVPVYGQDAIHYVGGADRHDYYVTNDANQVPIFVGPEEWTWPQGWQVGPQPSSAFNNLLPISACTGPCSAL